MDSNKQVVRTINGLSCLFAVLIQFPLIRSHSRSYRVLNQNLPTVTEVFTSSDRPFELLSKLHCHRSFNSSQLFDTNRFPNFTWSLSKLPISSQKFHSTIRVTGTHYSSPSGIELCSFSTLEHIHIMDVFTLLGIFNSSYSDCTNSCANTLCLDRSISRSYRHFGSSLHYARPLDFRRLSSSIFFSTINAINVLEHLHGRSEHLKDLWISMIQYHQVPLSSQMSFLLLPGPLLFHFRIQFLHLFAMNFVFPVVLDYSVPSLGESNIYPSTVSTVSANSVLRSHSLPSKLSSILILVSIVNPSSNRDIKLAPTSIVIHFQWTKLVPAHSELNSFVRSSRYLFDVCRSMAIELSHIKPFLIFLAKLNSFSGGLWLFLQLIFRSTLSHFETWIFVKETLSSPNSFCLDLDFVYRSLIQLSIHCYLALITYTLRSSVSSLRFTPLSIQFKQQSLAASGHASSDPLVLLNETTNSHSDCLPSIFSFQFTSSGNINNSLSTTSVEVFSITFRSLRSRYQGFAPIRELSPHSSPLGSSLFSFDHSYPTATSLVYAVTGRFDSLLLASYRYCLDLIRDSFRSLYALPLNFLKDLRVFSFLKDLRVFRFSSKTFASFALQTKSPVLLRASSSILPSIY